MITHIAACYIDFDHFNSLQPDSLKTICVIVAFCAFIEKRKARNETEGEQKKWATKRECVYTQNVSLVTRSTATDRRTRIWFRKMMMMKKRGRRNCARKRYPCSSLPYFFFFLVFVLDATRLSPMVGNCIILNTKFPHLIISSLIHLLL